MLASTWTSPDDLKHAERQLDYARLSRAQKDEQDKWAAAKGTELAPCPNNWGWLRYHLHPLAGGRKYPGYVCEGGVSYTFLSFFFFLIMLFHSDPGPLVSYIQRTDHVNRD